MIPEFQPIKRVNPVAGLQVGNFELVKKIDDVHELIAYLQANRSIFWNFKVLPTAFFLSWQLKQITDSISRGIFWSIKSLNSKKNNNMKENNDVPKRNGIPEGRELQMSGKTEIIMNASTLVKEVNEFSQQFANKMDEEKEGMIIVAFDKEGNVCTTVLGQHGNLVNKLAKVLENPNVPLFNVLMCVLKKNDFLFNVLMGALRKNDFFKFKD